LRELDPTATYEVRNQDTGEVMVATGEELMTRGFSVKIGERPGSALFFYRRAAD